MKTPVSTAPAALAAQELAAVYAALLPACLSAQGAMLAVKDVRSGRYVHVNDAMAAFLQRPPAHVLGHRDAELFEPAVATALRAADQTALANAGPLTCEHGFDRGGVRREFAVLRVATGADLQGRRWLCSVWSDLADQRQREAQARLALEQIEQQQRANEMLRRELTDQALRDPVSGLYRRAHFEDQLRREVDLSTREHREFALVFVEVDALAPKVLALGETGQRRVFETLGRLLRGGTRAMDASCRYDGQRFAVLLSGVGLATAHSRMEGLRRKCEAEIVVHEGQELGFSVAMGVASYPHTAHTLEVLAKACEDALALARSRGNHVTLAAICFDATSGDQAARA